MKKLKALEYAAKLAQHFGGKMEIMPHTILAIAEAFSALERARDAFRSNYSDEYELRKQVEKNWDRLAAASGWVDSRDQNAVNNDFPRQFDSAVEMAASWKQRAEAVEERLAELEKQKPDYYATGFRLLTASEIEQYDRLKLSKIGLMKLFTRPVPAVSLANLVPDEIKSAVTEGVRHGIIDGEIVNPHRADGYNACIADILRKIEEAK